MLIPKSIGRGFQLSVASTSSARSRSCSAYPGSYLWHIFLVTCPSISEHFSNYTYYSPPSFPLTLTHKIQFWSIFQIHITSNLKFRQPPWLVAVPPPPPLGRCWVLCCLVQVDFLQLSVDDHVQLSRLQGNAQWNSPTTSFDGWFFFFSPDKGCQIVSFHWGSFLWRFLRYWFLQTGKVLRFLWKWGQTKNSWICECKFSKTVCFVPTGGCGCKQPGLVDSLLEPPGQSFTMQRWSLTDFNRWAWIALCFHGLGDLPPWAATWKPCD